MITKRLPAALRTCVLLGFVAAVLNGCALLYFPMLLFVPLQPVIMMIVKVAARYGPLFLMLLVEADPQLPGTPDTMLAVQPAQFTPQTQLDDLESRLLYETAHTPGLVSASIVESDIVTEKWLQQQLSTAADNGWQIRLVFVDSRKYRDGKQLSEAAQIRLADSGIPIRTAGPLAARVGGRCAREINSGLPGSRTSSDAAYASLAGVMLPELR
jgi:hypothetical protein